MIKNVLSLFDGMSCGQIALNRAGIKYDKYFASEVDKYVIEVTQKNYPNTIQIGDVCKVKGSDLPKIDLLIGGSPCQGFSTAGKNLNFNDPRSKLFFEYVRLLKECKPKYFLLENVIMNSRNKNIITSYLNVEPIKINSVLVSAQNRIRLYWTNISGIKQPEDKGILLKDIIENDKTIKNFKINNETRKVTCKEVPQFFKKHIFKICNINPSGRGMNGWVYHTDFKSCAISTNHGEGSKISNNGISYRNLTPIECERLQTVPDNYTNHVSNAQRYKMLGNGWTVDVVAHIFKFLKIDPAPKIDKPCSLIPWHELDIAIEEEK